MRRQRHDSDSCRVDALLDDLPGPLRLDVMSHLARDILDSVPLFKYSPPALRDQLLMSLELQTYPPDCHVVREDSIGDEIYFVTQGTVEITSNGGTRTHGTLVAGDYFGYMSMALNEKRTGSSRSPSRGKETCMDFTCLSGLLFVATRRHCANSWPPKMRR